MQADPKKTQRILNFIHTFSDEHGYTPTYREIMKGAKISSTSLVEPHLKILADRGEIALELGSSRTIRILKPRMWTGVNSRAVAIPYLGVTAAGLPLPIPDADTGVYAVEPEYTVVDREELPRGELNSIFALHVKGDSMIDAHIPDGSTVIIKYQSNAESGDCVAANIKGEGATLKYYYPKDGHIELRPANTAYETKTYKAKQIEILGKLILVKRRY